MTYTTFIISIAAANLTLKFIEVDAVDLQAAYADVRAAYGDDVEIVNAQWK
jgi:hypothetical protein